MVVVQWSKKRDTLLSKVIDFDHHEELELLMHSKGKVAFSSSMPTGNMR